MAIWDTWPALQPANVTAAAMTPTARRAVVAEVRVLKRFTEASCSADETAVNVGPGFDYAE